LASRTPANLRLSVGVDGNARINDGAAEATLELVHGYGTFQVSTDLVEDIQVTPLATEPVLPGVTILEPLSLSFVKPYPAVELAEFEPVVDSLINSLVLAYNEPVYVDEASAQSLALVTLDGELVAGDFAVAEELVAFTPEQPLVLGGCYDVTTQNSSLKGVAANDPVLRQTLSVCAPRARLALPATRFVLEGSSQALTVELAEGLQASSLTNGQIHVRALGVEEYSRPFDWRNPHVQIPVYSGQAVADGQEIELVRAGLGSAIQPVYTANAISLRVLQANAAFDGDGLTNALEFSLPGLVPANVDSNGDGIADGDDDLDGDGLSNAEEVA